MAVEEEPEFHSLAEFMDWMNDQPVSTPVDRTELYRALKPDEYIDQLEAALEQIWSLTVGCDLTMTAEEVVREVSIQPFVAEAAERCLGGRGKWKA